MEFALDQRELDRKQWDQEKKELIKKLNILDQAYKKDTKDFRRQIASLQMKFNTLKEFDNYLRSEKNRKKLLAKESENRRRIERMELCESQPIVYQLLEELESESPDNELILSIQKLLDDAKK